jgi:hypothetical protein
MAPRRELGECFGEPYRLALRQPRDRIVLRSGPLSAVGRLQQGIQREAQNRGDLDQAPDADAACAAFVSVDLRNRDAQAPRKHRLRYALGETKRANSSTEGRIDRPSPLYASGVHGSAPREDARMEARFPEA